MANKKPTSSRQASIARKRKQKTNSTLLWVALAVGAIALIGFVLIRSFGSASAAETIPVPSGYETHQDDGTPPGPYPSDPPAGGRHYNSTLEARFYEESDLASLPAHPEGSLVHNLEHGYVIFWYNCALMDDAGCKVLKESIKDVMAGFNGVKVIAFPWSSLDVPVVMTSWGKLQRFETFDPGQARAFVKAYQNHSPEPNAP